MRRITPIAGAVVALAGWSLAAQVASTPGAGGPPPSLKSIGLIVYPASDQPASATTAPAMGVMRRIALLLPAIRGAMGILDTA